jgi:YidC/Oxa1 family membrane protein insertase
VDKKNTIIGILLLAAAVGCMVLGNKYAVPPPSNAQAVRQEVAEHAPNISKETALVASGTQANFVSASTDNLGAQTATLQNSYIKVNFTNFGGAIRDVALIHKLRNGSYQYPTNLGEPEPFVFNKLHADPALAFVNFPGLDRTAQFKLVSQSQTEVVYRTVISGGYEVTRRYSLAPDEGSDSDPYQLRTETTFKNLGKETVKPMRVDIAVGTAAPLDAGDNGLYLSAWYSDGKDPKNILRGKLEQSGGLFGMGAHDAISSIETPGPLSWAAVSNRFFVGILTPDQPASNLSVRRVKLLTDLSDNTNQAYGISDSAGFDLPALKPGDQTTLAASYYVGPKEYHRLSNSDVFKVDQDKVMQFGFFKFFSALLLTLMTWIHSFVPNWGLSIILTTLTLKIIFIYPTLSAFRSSRRMQKIQPQLKVINEKYKDNPTKKNMATMELFKEHKVNPMGGCLPMLLTMPFFFGFFSMLQSNADLRFASFLWAHDLSSPDTVGQIWGISINILPLMLGAVSFIQMRLTPQPTVDNGQAKMMMFMPLLFLFFCYKYSCALSLYSTTNGLFSIAQQLIINRSKDDGDPSNAAIGTNGKLIKNVTPSKK